MKLKKFCALQLLVAALLSAAAFGAYADDSAISPALTLDAGIQAILNVRAMGRDTSQLPVAQRKKIFGWYSSLVSSHGYVINRPSECLASLIAPDPRFSLEPKAAVLPLDPRDSCAPQALGVGGGGVGTPARGAGGGGVGK